MIPFAIFILTTVPTVLSRYISLTMRMAMFGKLNHHANMSYANKAPIEGIYVTVFFVICDHVSRLYSF